MNFVLQKRFKRLRRIEDVDSDAEEKEDDGVDRDAIAGQLFEGSDGVNCETIPPIPANILKKNTYNRINFFQISRSPRSMSIRFAKFNILL